jgi:uncharacterized phage protein (TIGR01671 family)
MSREHKYQLWDKEENKMYQCVTIACTNKNKWTPLIYTSDNIINGIDHDNYELLEYIGIKDKNETEIYTGYIVKIITREIIGERKHGSGRKSYTTTEYGNIESIGVVKYGKSKYPYDKVSTYYVDTDNKVEYGTYFFADKPSDGKTTTSYIIKKPIEIINDVEVLGNIYQNLELLEK